MGIDPIQGKPVLPVQWQSNQRLGVDSQSPAAVNEGADEVVLSGQTQEFVRIRKLVDAAPDVRKSQVDKLRQEVRLGRYNVSSSDIADAIVREHSIDQSI